MIICWPIPAEQVPWNGVPSPEGITIYYDMGPLPDGTIDPQTVADRWGAEIVEE